MQRRRFTNFNSDGRDPSRREFLLGLGLAGVWKNAPFGGAGLWKFAPVQPAGAADSNSPIIREFDFSSLESLYTPNDAFYIRDHFPRPSLDASKWRVRVSGQVRSPLELSLEEIARLPARTLSATLECAGNGVGGGAVSAATWTGIPLATLLRRARANPQAKYVRLVGGDRGDDGFETAPFARTIPIKKALDPDTLLAYQMNGAPLPPEHGFPLRAIVPGWYAMDSVKWLAAIEVLDHSDTGPFMTRDYVARQLEAVGSKSYQLTSLRVKSQISRPLEGETIAQKSYVIRGAAWAAGAVAQVEVSTDGGATWNTARLEGEPLAYTWSLWNYQWNIDNPRHYTLIARARDVAGDEQPRGRDPNRLDTYERNSYHAVGCEVL